MENIVERLTMSAHRSSTRKNYLSVWRTFSKFYLRLDRKPKTWEQRIVLFVGFLVQNKKKSTTIRSYVSAIRNILQEDKIELDENIFQLNALTKACKLTVDKVRTKLPIHKNLLRVIVKYVEEHFCNQPYLALLYTTIFVTAYYGLFRIGELMKGDHTIKVVDVQIGHNKRKLLFILRSSKTHGKYSHPQQVKITSNSKKHGSRRDPIDPFHLLRKYSEARRSCINESEPFFIFRDRTPVTPAQTRGVLHMALKDAKYNPNLYCFHMLRAGRAVDLMRMGVPIEVIKRLGRWKSNAVYEYLKI